MGTRHAKESQSLQIQFIRVHVIYCRLHCINPLFSDSKISSNGMKETEGKASCVPLPFFSYLLCSQTC